MALKGRVQKLINKQKPEKVKIFSMGWADSTWSESEGLFRQLHESKKDFCERVYKTTKKRFLWFE